MPTFVKIYDIISSKESVVTRENALNRLKHNHVKDGGRYCALNEVDYYNTPEPEPVIQELPEYIPELVEVKKVKPAAPPPPEEVEAIATPQADPQPTKKRRPASKSKAKK